MGTGTATRLSTRKKSYSHDLPVFLRTSSRSVLATLRQPGQTVDLSFPPQNHSNFAAHFTGTGPEIWRQTNGEVSAFVAGAGLYIPSSLYQAVCHIHTCVGTGGTIAGTGQFLKSMADDTLVVLADPEGSGLYNKVQSQNDR